MTFLVNVDDVNLPPVANVSLSESSGAVFSLLTLDATRSSDPEGQPLTYMWSVIDQPAGATGSVIDDTAATTTFFADTIGTYRVRLVVNDGVQDSDAVTFTIDITENLAPIANVSLSQNAGFIGVPLQLDGSRSTDPEGDNIGFTWTITSQPAGSNAQIASPSAAMTTAEFDTVGQYRCLLYTSPSPRDATLSRMPSSA